MQTIITVLVILIALEHLGFLYLEMFLWTKKAGRKVFHNTLESAEKTKVLAANQGLYNGFLAFGLLFGLFYPDSHASIDIMLFVLTCVFLAGVYGGLTANKLIFFIQGLPALLTLLLLLALIN
jgi:putative membrane protein